MHVYSRPDTTLDPPPSSSSPLSWASYHQSLGVLCAQLEWLGWALAFITVLGAAAHVPLQHRHQKCALSPAEQAGTYLHPLFSPYIIPLAHPSTSQRPFHFSPTFLDFSPLP